eukprot:2632056-Pleurochrysis_carterae.AAC.4
MASARDARACERVHANSPRARACVRACACAVARRAHLCLRQLGPAQRRTPQTRQSAGSNGGRSQCAHRVPCSSAVSVRKSAGIESRRSRGAVEASSGSRGIQLTADMDPDREARVLSAHLDNISIAGAQLRISRARSAEIVISGIGTTCPFMHAHRSTKLANAQ